MSRNRPEQVCTCPKERGIFNQNSKPPKHLWVDENGETRDENCPAHGQEVEGASSATMFPDAMKPNNRIGRK